MNRCHRKHHWYLPNTLCRMKHCQRPGRSTQNSRTSAQNGANCNANVEKTCCGGFIVSGFQEITPFSRAYADTPLSLLLLRGTSQCWSRLRYVFCLTDSVFVGSFWLWVLRTAAWKGLKEVGSLFLFISCAGVVVGFVVWWWWGKSVQLLHNP